MSHLTSWKLNQVNTGIIDGSWHKLLIFEKKIIDASMLLFLGDILLSWFVLEQHYTIHLQSIPLKPKAGKQVKSSSYFICLGFAKFFKLFPNYFQAHFWGQVPWYILINAKISWPSHQFYTFLLLIALPVHNLRCFHIWSSTLGICFTNYHLQTSPF